jgi:DNA-binding GntR family transcriptional regulator
MVVIQAKSISDQVEEILRERIRRAVYSPGGRMPSESDLSVEFGVSRATVRTVLARLAVHGLIVRRQGDGTYINARAREGSSHSGNLWDLVRLIESNGFKPSIQPLSIAQKSASEREAQALSIDPGEPLLSFRRLFLADGRPVILADNLAPLSLLHVPVEEIDASLHIRDILKRYFHWEIGFAMTDIRSALVGDEIRRLLGDGPSATILELRVTFYSRNDRPLALGLNHFDDSVLRISLIQAWS